MAEGQVKRSFDSVTINKIFKGMYFAVVLPFVIAALEFLKVYDFGDARITMLLTWFVPVLVNAINEWRKGQ